MIPLSDAHFILKWVKFGLIQKNKALQNTWKAYKINIFTYQDSSLSGSLLNHAHGRSPNCNERY